MEGGGQGAEQGAKREAALPGIKGCSRVTEVESADGEQRPRGHKARVLEPGGMVGVTVT